MTDRIAALETKIAEAQAELAALKAERPAPPSQVKEVREVSIRAVLDERNTDLPNLADLRKLYAVVKHRVPETKTHDPDAGFRGFLAAFRYVSNCGRIAAPNGKLGIGYWLDDMKGWLRQRDAMTMDVTGASFVAATIAAGDIQYVPHDSMMGHVWEFGIVPPNHGGKPASPDAWRKVLDGSVLAPVAPERRFAQPSPAQVFVGER
jgi:hypothetical protein